MRQLIKYILVVVISCGGYYAARRFEPPPTGLGGAEGAGLSDGAAENPAESEFGGRFAAVALIDTERTFDPVPLPEKQLGVAKQPTISKTPANDWAQPPEDEPRAPAHDTPRYSPPEFSQQFPSDVDKSSTKVTGKEGDRTKSKDRASQGNRKRSKPNQIERSGNVMSDTERPGQKKHSEEPASSGATDRRWATGDQEYEGSTGRDETSDEYGSDEYGSDEYGSDEYGSDEYGSDEYGSDEYGSDEYGSRSFDTGDYGEESSEGDSYPWDEENSWDPWSPGKKQELASEEDDKSTAAERQDRNRHAHSGGWTASDGGESSETGGQRVHRVVDGDTLGSLAKRYLGRSDRFLEIFKANSDRLYDPRLLPIGLELVIPNANEAIQTSRSSSMLQNEISNQRSDAASSQPSSDDLETVPTFTIRRRS